MARARKVLLANTTDVHFLEHIIVVLHVIRVFYIMDTTNHCIGQSIRLLSMFITDRWHLIFRNLVRSSVYVEMGGSVKRLCANFADKWFLMQVDKFMLFKSTYLVEARMTCVALVTSVIFVSLLVPSENAWRFK